MREEVAPSTSPGMHGVKALRFPNANKVFSITTVQKAYISAQKNVSSTRTFDASCGLACCKVRYECLKME